MELKATKHSYYCVGQNVEEFDSWADFSKEWELDSLDFDYNYLVRFDIFDYDLTDDDEWSQAILDYKRVEFHFLHQRSGGTLTAVVHNLTLDDIAHIEALLKRAWEYTKDLWKEVLE